MNSQKRINFYGKVFLNEVVKKEWKLSLSIAKKLE